MKFFLLIICVLPHSDIKFTLVSDSLRDSNLSGMGFENVSNLVLFKDIVCPIWLKIWLLDVSISHQKSQEIHLTSVSCQNLLQTN